MMNDEELLKLAAEVQKTRQAWEASQKEVHRLNKEAVDAKKKSVECERAFRKAHAALSEELQGPWL